MYGKEVAIAFCKALEKDKVIVKGAHNNPNVINTLVEVINLDEEKAKNENSTIQMFYGEFTDWIETSKFCQSK